MRFWSDEEGVRRYYPLREGSLLIGRHPSCHIVIPGRNVSKQHLQCYIQNNVVTIRDLGSSNGTTVNGNPVTSCVLKHGDELALGGYRLVLDVTADAPAAPPPDPYAAQATFDYEPTQSPKPEDTVAPTGRQQEISFQKEPGQDDTPADGTFVPQTYAPQSLQPQVVARDGHMYLRDPRTNRELEIVPRGAGAQTDLSGYYAERETAEKKKNTYLIGGAIAVGLLMIVVLALTSGPADDRPDNREPVFPRTRYNEIAEQSINLMKAGEFAKAIKELKEADKGRSTYRVAAMLLAIAEEWEKSGKSYDEFNWLSVESTLGDLIANRWSTTKIVNFAKGRRQWTRNRQRQLQVVRKALQLIAAGEPEKALEEFAKLPLDSPVRQEQEPQVRAATRACFRKRMRQGKAALDGQDWDGAIAHYRAASQYASAADGAEIERGITYAEKQKKQDQILSDANVMRREDTISSLKGALRLLDRIDDTGPLADRKRTLRNKILQRLDQIAREDKVRLARAYYEAGRGPEAIQLITRSSLTELYSLRSTIERVIKLAEDAEKALKKKDYNLTKTLWLQLAQEETSTKNAYYKRAMVKVDELKQKAKDIALHYNALADAALRKNDPATARKMYRWALKWDPHAVVGKDGLRNLLHIAQVTYSRAVDLRYKGEKDKAIQAFEKVRRYAEEGGKLHQDATRHLGELRAGK